MDELTGTNSPSHCAHFQISPGEIIQNRLTQWEKSLGVVDARLYGVRARSPSRSYTYAAGVHARAAGGARARVRERDLASRARRAGGQRARVC